MDTITAETCVCGSNHWHELVRTGVLWCSRCGALRIVFSERWNIPLDRAGEIPHTKPPAPPEEPPTNPGGRRPSSASTSGVTSKPPKPKDS